MKRDRPVRLAITLALGLGLVGAACSSSDHSPASVSSAAGKQLELRADMRKLWEDHITWTRVVIISAAAGLPDFDAAAGRLLRNQEDIGSAMKPFYGDAAGDQLTSLLKEHITTAADLLKAAKANDSVAQDQARSRWYDNANQIAAFLSQANPKHWPLSETTTMMRDHLDLTLAEAVARLSGDYAGDVVAYDRVHDEILRMADMLSDGIISQFPKRFA